MTSRSFGACVLSVFVVALLALGTLPIPSAQAQGLVDTSYPSESLLPAATPFVEIVTDPADTGLALPAEGPVNPDYAAPVDILSLSVAETEDQLLFAFKHRGYPEFPATTSEFVPTQQIFCSIQFAFNGNDASYYSIYMFGESFQDGGAYRYFADAYRFTRAENNDRYTYYEGDYLGEPEVVLIGGDHLETFLAKESLLVGSEARPLRAGDKMTDVETFCYRSSVPFQSYFDYNQDGSLPYSIKTASRSAELQVTFVNEFASGAVSVPAAGTTKVPVAITNLRQRNLLVNITATLKDDAGAVIPGWKISSPPPFELRGNSTLPASLVITPPPGAQHRDGGTLEVRATALGFDKPAVVKKALFATVDPSPSQITLYFHGSDYQIRCGVVCGDGLPVRTLYFESLFMGNVLPNDPVFGEDDVENEGVAFFSDDSAIMILDAPVSRGLRFNPEGMFEFQVSLRSDVARDLIVNVEVVGEEHSFARGQQVVPVTETYSTHTLTFPTNLEALTLPAGQLMAAFVSVREASVPLGIQNDAWISPVSWRPAETHLTLPLINVPQAQVDITDGRALPSLALSNTTNAEEYINPGQTQAFDMFLINEGTESDVIGLKAEFDQPGWKIAYHPGERFDLRPGQSAPLCVSITAPSDARDADVVNVNLTAWSRLDPAVRSATALQLIVVDSIDIEGSTCLDRGDDEYVAPFVDDRAEAPGAPVALLLSALGMLAFVARRRK